MHIGGFAGSGGKGPGRRQAVYRVAVVILSAGLLGGCSGLVNGTKTAIQAAFQLGASSLNFGKVTVGKQSTQSVSISNTGNTNVSITQVTFSNPQFSLPGAAFPMPLATGQSSNLTVAVTPTSSGAVTGTMMVQGDGGSSPVSLDLSATAAASGPQISLSSTTVHFGTVSINSTGSASVTISNAGSSDLTVSVISLSGAEFGVSGIATPKTISAGQSAQMALTFHPTAAGAVTGSVSITSNDPANPTATIEMDGTGSTSAVGQLQANPTSLSFGNVSVGSKLSKQITLTNTGTGAVQMSGVTVAGAEFSANGIAFPYTLNPSATVTLNVVFAPTAAGAVTGSVTVNSNAGVSALTIAVSGTGVQSGLSVSPASFNFGSVVDGQTKSQAFTLTNTGNASLTISQLTVSGAGYRVSGLTTPATVAAGASTTFSAVFAPTTAGSLNGTVTISSNAPNSPATIALSGTGVQAQSGLSVAPTSFNYGSVVDGQTKSQTFTLTNTGNASLTISQLTVSGAGYSVNGLTTPATVAAGASTTFSAVFAPTTAGSLNGTVTISSNAPNSPATISLSGTGVASTVTVSANPTSLSFGNVNAGSSSTKSVTLTNGGNSNVTLSQITVGAKDVTESGITLPVTLTPGQTQTMSVKFSPTAAETVSGNITVTNSQSGSTVISVSGTGLQAGISLNPSSAAFGNVVVGATNSQTIQISNPGNATLTITQANVTGTGFGTSGLSLPLSINPGQSSTFNAQFDPSGTGSVSGSISIVSNAAGSPDTVTLSGTGIAATETLSFSTTTVGFGNVNTGSSSTQTETITNTGNSNVQISQIAVSGAGYSLSGASAPVTLNPSQKLTFSIIFSPTAAGSDSGSVTITSNATGSPATITLSGTGVQASSHTVALSWTASTSTVSGYNVYRSTTSGSGYTKVNSSLVPGETYTDSTVSSGTTYYYVTTAVDSSGDESAYSNQASAVIP